MTVELFQRRKFGPARPAHPQAANDNGSGIAEGDTAAIFNDWATTATSLAMWRRHPPADLKEHLAGVQLDKLAGWRCKFDVKEAATVIAEAMPASGFCNPTLEGRLGADITLLTRIFANSTGTSHIEARLEVVRDDACRRFHVDSYPERLLVTYIGAGTVWVPRCYGRQAIAEQENYSGPTLEIPAFSVGLFAGEKNGRAGLVHRSPRIAGTGRMRLFFCVNAAMH